MATALAAVGAVATIGGALIGSKSSKDATKAAVKGQEQAQGITAASASQARGDVNRLFGTADTARRGGFSSAADFIGGNIGRQIAPFQQGNVAAQEQIGRGLNAQQAAILGLPTDLSGFGARSFGDPNQFNIASPFQQAPQQPQPQGFQLNQNQLQGIQGGLADFASRFGGGLGSGGNNRFSNLNFRSQL